MDQIKDISQDLIESIDCPQVEEEDDDDYEEEKEDEEGVVSYVENEMLWYKTYSIVLKSLITRRVENSFQKTSKSLKTSVKFVSQKSNYLVSISGVDRNKVIESKSKFNQLISLSRKNRPFTHLITIPFNCQPLRHEFILFKDNVLTNFKDLNGIDETLFQKPFILHLTFCVLVLLNENEILLAKKVLKQSFDQIVRPIVNDKPLKVSVEGLDVIKGEPTRAHVLYAQIKDESNKLQTIADEIVDQFVKSGLLEESRENKVKLHITFMNSLFRQRILSKTNPKTSKKQLKRQTFVAKPIIDFYNSYKFGEIAVESIQLNDIKTRTEDGFYGLVECIHLPKEPIIS